MQPDKQARRLLRVLSYLPVHTTRSETNADCSRLPDRASLRGRPLWSAAEFSAVTRGAGARSWSRLGLERGGKTYRLLRRHGLIEPDPMCRAASVIAHDRRGIAA
jgi:hypothetical protein